MKQILRFVLFILALAFILELALSLTDPNGLRFIHSLQYAAAHMTGDPYQPAPGVHDFGTWLAVVHPDGTRYVPDSSSGCTIALFGDSITFGWGVGDHDTFANQLARLWGVRVINAGVTGYNSAQVRQAVERIPFDTGVWLIVNNDAQVPLGWGGAQIDGTTHRYPGMGLIHGSDPALAVYGRYWTARLQGIAQPANDMARFEADVGAIVNRGVTLFAFDEPLGQWAAQRFDVHLLPMYDTTVSAADAHPDAQSHAGIAAGIADVFEPCVVE